MDGRGDLHATRGGVPDLARDPVVPRRAVRPCRSDRRIPPARCAAAVRRRVRLRPAGQHLWHGSREIAVLVDPLVNQVCRVNINSQCQRGPDTFPFTGRKDSAEGTLSVSDALRVFTIRTLVAATETDANRAIIRSIVSNRSSTFLSTDFIL